MDTFRNARPELGKQKSERKAPPHHGWRQEAHGASLACFSWCSLCPWWLRLCVVLDVACQELPHLPERSALGQHREETLRQAEPGRAEVSFPGALEGGETSAEVSHHPRGRRGRCGRRPSRLRLKLQYLPVKSLWAPPTPGSKAGPTNSPKPRSFQPALLRAFRKMNILDPGFPSGEPAVGHVRRCQMLLIRYFFLCWVSRYLVLHCGGYFFMF